MHYRRELNRINSSSMVGPPNPAHPPDKGTDPFRETDKYFVLRNSCPIQSRIHIALSNLIKDSKGIPPASHFWVVIPFSNEKYFAFRFYISRVSLISHGSRVIDPIEHALACPAKSVPVELRQTGMEGALNGQCKKAHSGADCEHSASG